MIANCFDNPSTHLRCTAASMDFDNPSTTNVVPTPPLHSSFRRLTQGRHWSVPLFNNPSTARGGPHTSAAQQLPAPYTGEALVCAAE